MAIRDPRRFRGHSQILGAILGAAGGDGGGVEAVDPGDVDFEDSSFDANTQTRFKSASPIRNILSGGKGDAEANKLNTQQVLDDAATKRDLYYRPQEDQLDVAKAKKEAQDKADIGLATQEQSESNETNRRARDLYNQDTLDLANEYEGVDLGDALLGEKDKAPREEIARASALGTKYGKVLDSRGTSGAGLQEEEDTGRVGDISSIRAAREANTDYIKAHTEYLKKTGDIKEEEKPLHVGDNTLYFPKKNAYSIIIPEHQAIDDTTKTVKTIPARQMWIDAGINSSPTAAPAVKTAVTPATSAKSSIRGGGAEVTQPLPNTFGAFIKNQKETLGNLEDSSVGKAVTGVGRSIRKFVTSGKREGESWAEYYKRTGKTAPSSE